MPTMTLKAVSDLVEEFEPEPRGARVRLVVESERPVRAYLLDDRGLDEYYDEEGDSFTTLAGPSRADTYLVLRGHIPRDTVSYLLIINEGKRPTAVHWDFR